jgi:hypothetical protein
LSGFDNFRDDCRRERIALIRNVLGNCEIPDEDIPFIAWIGKSTGRGQFLSANSVFTAFAYPSTVLERSSFLL